MLAANATRRGAVANKAVPNKKLNPQRCFYDVNNVKDDILIGQYIEDNLQQFWDHQHLKGSGQ